MPIPIEPVPDRRRTERAERSLRAGRAGHRRRGVTTSEVLLAFGALAVLLAILIPSMQRARLEARSEGSRDHLRRLHGAFTHWLGANDDAFPFVAEQPGWRWGGVRHSSVTGRPFLDSDRPLSHPQLAGTISMSWFKSPGDRGIRGSTSGVGTGDRTCFEAFGTSYRANDALFDVRLSERTDAVAARPARGFGGDGDDELDELRGLRLSEIATAPERLVILGEPLWAEVVRGTERDAAWYDDPERANLLYLDGHVAWTRVVPGPADLTGPVFDPQLAGTSDDRVLAGGDDRAGDGGGAAGADRRGADSPSGSGLAGPRSGTPAPHERAGVGRAGGSGG